MTYAYTSPADDKRYKTKRWKDTRLRVLRRDGYRCWITGCQVRANVADHIVPSSLDMPDFEFYSMANLRASCKRHNTARGVAARLDREMSDGVAPVVVRSSLVRSSGFFRSGGDRDRPLVQNLSPVTPPSNVVTRDYSRKAAEG
jgi:hypothetical protein